MIDECSRDRTWKRKLWSLPVQAQRPFDGYANGYPGEPPSEAACDTLIEHQGLPPQVKLKIRMAPGSDAAVERDGGTGVCRP